MATKFENRRQKAELEEKFSDAWASWKIEGFKSTPAKKVKFKKLYMSDLPSGKIVAIIKKEMGFG